MLEIIFPQIFFFLPNFEDLALRFPYSRYGCYKCSNSSHHSSSQSRVCVCVCVCVCVYVFSSLKAGWICWEISQWYHLSAGFCGFRFCFFNPLSRKLKGFRGGSEVQNLTANVGDMGLIPGSGRSPGEGNGSPFQYSCLGKPLDREAWQATVRGVTKESDTT